MSAKVVEEEKIRKKKIYLEKAVSVTRKREWD